jgi:NADPH:quinone reductase-like Zn-dependent oxidoreductase
MNGLTARMSLDMLALVPGQTIGVTGAAGVLGGYVVQLASAAGLRVLADAAPADEALVRGFGADVVVERGEQLAAAWRVSVPAGLDAVVDAALIGAPILPAIRDGGALARVRGAGERGVSPLEPERGIVFHQVRVPAYGGDRARLEDLRERAERGELTLRVAATYSPEQAADAHRRLEAGGTRGRLVIEF